MVKKKKIPSKLQREVRQMVAEFCRENPQIDTLEKFEQVMKMVIAVGCLPPAIYQGYRNSGKSVEQVYEEIMTKN